MVTRFPWGNFPSVITHTTRANLEAHPSYAAARHDDLKAAREVARAFLRAAQWSGRVDYVCPTIEFSPDGRFNPLPLALAELLARETGAELVASIVRQKQQAEIPTDSVSRLLNQSGYDGKPPKGSYLIVHDVCVFGSSIANLRGHIHAHGGDVLAATSLASHLFAANLVPDNTVLMGIAARFRNELNTIPTHLGFDYDRLTAREAYFIYGLRNLECIRNPQVPSHRVTTPRF